MLVDRCILCESYSEVLEGLCVVTGIRSAGSGQADGCSLLLAFQVTVPLPASQLSLPNFGSTGQPLIALPQTLQPPLQHTTPQAQAPSLSRPTQVSQPFRGLIPAGAQHSMIATTGKMSEMELKAFGSGIDMKPGTPPISGRSTTPTSSPFRATSTSPSSQSSKMNSIVYQKQFPSAPAAVRMAQPFPTQFAPQKRAVGRGLSHQTFGPRCWQSREQRCFSPRSGSSLSSNRANR